MGAFWRRLTEPRPDPNTGDMLSTSDRISWFLQGLIRHWWFIIGNVVLSVVWWAHPHWFGDTQDYPRWMALYSLLAVVIESVVGLGMFGQTKRDAAALREVRAMATRIEEMASVILRDVAEIEEELEGAEDEGPMP
jgi:hypothetical protein